MDCTETLTASGRGRWGYHETTYATSTVRQEWRARWSDQSRAVQTFVLSFQIEGREPDRRSFPTQEARDAFLDASITDRSPGGDGSHLLGACPALALAYVGERLEAVSFVDDYYLMLEFHGGNGLFYAWPEARLGSSTLRFGDAGYRDQLSKLIGHDVRFADVFLDDGLVIGFDEGELLVSPEQIRSAPQPEVVDGPLGGLYAGEAPFD